MDSEQARLRGMLDGELEMGMGSEGAEKSGKSQASEANVFCHGTTRLSWSPLRRRDVA